MYPSVCSLLVRLCYIFIPYALLGFVQGYPSRFVSIRSLESFNFTEINGNASLVVLDAGVFELEPNKTIVELEPPAADGSIVEQGGIQETNTSDAHFTLTFPTSEGLDRRESDSEKRTAQRVVNLPAQGGYMILTLGHTVGKQLLENIFTYFVGAVQAHINNELHGNEYWPLQNPVVFEALVPATRIKYHLTLANALAPPAQPTMSWSMISEVIKCMAPAMTGMDVNNLITHFVVYNSLGHSVGQGEINIGSAPFSNVHYPP